MHAGLDDATAQRCRGSVNSCGKMKGFGGDLIFFALFGEFFIIFRGVELWKRIL